MGRGQNKNKATGPISRSSGMPDLPLYEVERLIHLGTLNPEHKGKFSWEGHGLSVSRDPELWGSIARIGGDEYTVTSDTGLKLLSVHDLDEVQRRTIHDWAFAEGLVEEQTGFEVSRYDDELEDTFSFFFRTRAEAEEEAGEGIDITGVEPDEITEVTVLIPTEKMKGLMGGMDIPDRAEDFIFPLYVEAERPDLDGVWWEDSYGPMSAPRGVIVPRRLSALKISIDE